MVGTTITSMMARESSRISFSDEPTGPLGSSTPEQPDNDSARKKVAADFRGRLKTIYPGLVAEPELWIIRWIIANSICAREHISFIRLQNLVRTRRLFQQARFIANDQKNKVRLLPEIIGAQGRITIATKTSRKKNLNLAPDQGIRFSIGIT
jgi:hypothetical protein